MTHNPLLKSLFDITCSLLAIIVLSFPMFITVLLVKLTSPGPIWSDMREAILDSGL